MGIPLLSRKPPAAAAAAPAGPARAPAAPPPSSLRPPPSPPATPPRPAAPGNAQSTPEREPVPTGYLTPQELLKRVRRLQLSISTAMLTPGTSPGGASGALKTLFRQVGGYDVVDRKMYEEGDDPRSIDWRATARTGKAVVKISHQSIESTLWLCLDTSGSTWAGLADVKRNVMIEICATIALTAAMAEERYGLLMMTDRIERSVQPQAGRIQFDVVTRELCYFNPKSAGTDLPKCLRELAGNLRGMGVVFVISDFIGVDLKELAETIRAIKSKKHEVVAIRILDPVDFELPQVGLVHVENPETRDLILVDTYDPEVRKAYAAKARESDEKLRIEMRNLGIPAIDIQTTDAPAEMLRKFFVLRAKARAGARAG